MTFNSINKKLIKSDSVDLPDNFIALAVMVSSDGVAQHSGLLIRYNSKTYLCHYWGEILIEEEPIDDWYYHKDLVIINGKLAPGFLAHCELIKDNAKPEYAFYFDGSFYKDGKYFSSNHTTEFMTCVGFCLYVLRGFLMTDYIEYTDWDSTSIPSSLHKKYVEDFINKIKHTYPDAEVSKIKNEMRRIAPDEYLSSGYLANLPIRKKQIDELLPNVQKAISGRKKAS